MNFAQLLLPDFALIVCGYLLCRFTALNRGVWEPLERMVYFFLFPILLFHAIVSTPLELQATTQLMTAGVALGVAIIGLAYSLRHWPGLGARINLRLHAASAQVGFRFNSYILLALGERALGPAGMPLVAILIGVCVPIFNVAAVWPMARHSHHGLVRELLRNPLVIATSSALACNLAGWSLPLWLAPTTERIGQASLVLGLMAVGAGMQWARLHQAKVLALAVLSIKHLASPVLALLIALAWGLNLQHTQVLLMFAAMPTASSCYVLAARMGYDGPYVANLVTMSTALGLLSLPLALGVLLPLR